MLGSRKNVSSIFERILRFAFYYATIFGVICFRLKRTRSDERFVVRSCFWYKWLCVLIRIIMCYFYLTKYRFDNFKWDLSQVEILICIRVFGCLTVAVAIVALHLLYEVQVLRLVNSFLRIFRRANALSSGRDMVFGGKRELALMLFKMISVVIEFFFIYQAMSEKFYMLHTNMSTAIVYHICFLGYLSLGALYDSINSYVRNQLRQQLRDLEHYEGVQPCRRRLKAAEQRLDECLHIYEEIQRVAICFHKLFGLVLSFLFVFGFLNLALVSYLLLFDITFTTNFWIVGLKFFLDLMLLIVVIHGARSSSRVVRRLSLENYYISERNEWHLKFEMFLNRLNYYEFRVRPLGLFEVSNELILVFLSGMVTYLTYVLQYSMQSQKN